MKQLIENSEFVGAKVFWNHLWFDESKPLSAHLNSLREDLLFVWFENGCTLDVGWLPSGDIEGAFHVKVNQAQDGGPDKLLETIRISSLAGLRQTLDEVLQTISICRPVPVPLLFPLQRPSGLTIDVNVLVNRFEPLNIQSLPKLLFEGHLNNGFLIRVIRLLADGLEARLDRMGPLNLTEGQSPQTAQCVPVKVVTCNSIQQLEPIIDEMLRVARQSID